MHKVVDFKSVKLSCAACSLSQLCLPRGLNNADFDKVATMVEREHPLIKGESLFELGQPFKALYAIRSGSVKVYLPTNDGDEQIVGFHMPGELLGFDAMGHDEHTCTAVALEDSSICELPYAQLHKIAKQVPSLSNHFMMLMSNEIADEHKVMLMLGKKSAEERIAIFLLSLSARFSHRGFSANQFNLSMSRQDMGNYLSMAVETISRCISHMQDEKIIEADRKQHIHILDMPRLRALAGVDEPPFQLLEGRVE